MPDEELERFKTQINLTEFAAVRGYALDRAESSRNSAMMRHPDGGKIVIAKNEASGDWIYFSVRDDRDNGTVIDFVQHLDGVSLGKVRQTLRAWLGSPRPALQPSLFVKDLEPVSRDRAAVVAVWERAKNCFALPYLASRGIGPDVLMLPRFSGRVRVEGQHGNVLFAHHDKGGLCGFEIKNKGFTGFSTGGVKGVWYSQALPTDRRLVLVESAIDGLSFHALQGDGETRYMSTGGTLNPQQPALLRGAMEKLPPGAIVLLAFDNDEGGERIAQEVAAFAPSSCGVRRVLPDVGKDWNDTLKSRLGLT